MKYLIKERMFSIGNKFDIRDERGRVKFVVEGKIFSLGKKLKIYDINGKLLIRVEQKLLKLLDEYRIIENNREVAKISRKVSLFRPKYNISSIYGDYRVQGDIIRHDFNIFKGRKLSASIRKKMISLSDTYSVDISEGEDHAFILAMVIVLDQVHHDGSVTSSGN